MRDVGIWCVVAQHYHRLPGTPLIARLLLMKESIKHHFISPVELSIVMEECSHDIGSRNSSNIVSKTFADPGEHESNVYTTEVSEL